MRPLADFSEEIFQVRQEWNDTGKALIKKRKKLPTNTMPIKTVLQKQRRHMDFPGGAVGKNPPANSGNRSSTPGPGRWHILWSS